MVWQQQEDKPKNITLHFKGKDILLTLQDDGVSYKDDYGTLYPEADTDPGYAGLNGILETGKGDPLWQAAKNHDAAFNRLHAGYLLPGESNASVFGKFAVDIGTQMLAGAYSLSLGIPYLVVGGLGGMIRWWQYENEKK